MTKCVFSFRFRGDYSFRYVTVEEVRDCVILWNLRVLTVWTLRPGLFINKLSYCSTRRRKFHNRKLHNFYSSLVAHYGGY